MKTILYSLIFFLLSGGFCAQAAVKNIRLSGEITARGIYRNNLDLRTSNDASTYNSAVARGGADSHQFVMSTVRVRINADLTDNIEGEIELLNQRDWGGPDFNEQGYVSDGVINATAGNDSFDVLINLANVKIKEVFFQPVNITIGRQEIQWGDGFVIGRDQVFRPDPGGNLSADEFTAFHGFDAVRAVYFNHPYYLDMVAILVEENTISRNDDEVVLGANLGRDWEKYDAETETYFLYSRNGEPADLTPIAGVGVESQDIYAMGIRGSFRPKKNLFFSGEFVYQFGHEGGVDPVVNRQPFSLNGSNSQGISAYGLDLRAEYQCGRFAWPTNFGAGYVYYSGEEMKENGLSSNYRPLYRGKFYSVIREFQGLFYLPFVSVTPGYTNQHQFMVDLMFHPLNNENLTFFARWLQYWLDEVPLAGRSHYLGDELNVKLTIDYTKDLSFSIIGAVFFPGPYFDESTPFINAQGNLATESTDIATELIGEVRLIF